MADRDLHHRRRLRLVLRSGVIASGTLIVTGLLTGHPKAAGAGILTLIAAPLAGLTVLGIGWAAEKEFRLAALCAGLLALVALGAFLGTG